jgi:trk system potassium uptake protein TrkH
MILAIIGGLSIPVLLDLTGAIFGQHKTTTHTRIVLRMTALLYLLGLAACMPWGDSAMTWRAALATGSAASIDARTAGLPLVSITGMTRFAQWLIIALMMIGAASGSTAGGLKLTTVFELFRGTDRALRRQIPGRIFGIAVAWLGLYLLILAGTLLALLAVQPDLPADRLLFIAASAVSCVGLSHDPISMAGGGLVVLSIAMLLGRLVPLAVLWWAVCTTPDADLAIG